MAKSSKSSGRVPEYDLTNPVVNRVWFDPRKRYTWESYRAGWNNFLSITRKNYSTLPLLMLTTVIVPVAFTFYLGFRLTHWPDVFSPNVGPHWDDWDNRHAKLNTPSPEGMKVLMSKHPRPHFEWKPKDKPKKFQRFVFGKKKEPKEGEPPQLSPHSTPRGL